MSSEMSLQAMAAKLRSALRMAIAARELPLEIEGVTRIHLTEEAARESARFAFLISLPLTEEAKDAILKAEEASAHTCRAEEVLRFSGKYWRKDSKTAKDMQTTEIVAVLKALKALPYMDDTFECLTNMGLLKGITKKVTNVEQFVEYVYGLKTEEEKEEAEDTTYAKFGKDAFLAQLVAGFKLSEDDAEAFLQKMQRDL